ncbi:MAG TPA: efflux RND transporter periplasmic adaptor subunit [Bryobacteraceae bacterium]|nr:efflux RND transporter periplasmic adaptor subunit [Bryobacteraceae bacterium]
MIETEVKFVEAPVRGPRFRGAWLLAAILVIVAAIVVVTGIRSRIAAASAVREKTLELEVPTVAVVHPAPGDLKNEVLLPGNVQPLIDAPIYARATGYVKQWSVDIGARVKAGQTLAELDAPELDQQVQQAKSNLQQAQASLEQSLASYEQGRSNEELARVTADRWKNLVARGVVSKQENDQYQMQYQAQVANVQALDKAINAARGTVGSMQANLSRLEDLQNYKIIRAPFDGVITARNTDIGALVNGGNGAPNQELFHLAAINKLRVFVNVPEIYSRAAIPGITANLTLSEFPGRSFLGKLVRTAGAIDAGTRTLLTELEVDNPSGELKPGSYAEVHLKLPVATQTLTLPVNAIIFRSEGQQVAVVRQGNKVQLVNVQTGRDSGTQMEIVSGLSATDEVIVNPPDSLVSGTEVNVK